MEARLFLGAEPIAAVPTGDRGLAYGDGLFETMRAVVGDVPWWDRHLARLQAGAGALGVALPDAAHVHAEIAALLGGRGGVVKLVVTRGGGGRGYAPTPGPVFWMISMHPVPTSRERVALRWCETRLSTQPRLAGLKHCNRLEQVLARAEWGEEVDEGLVRDLDGFVVSAVAANLFVLTADGWTTPRLDRCGVRGVCRSWALDALGAREARLAPEDVEAAEAVFVCNAVRGILEVERLGERTWSPHPQVAGLRERLAAEHPAFAPTPETP